MRKRPISLILSSLLFLYFPLEMYWRWERGQPFLLVDFLLSFVAPVILLIGLIRVSRIGWYTLIACVSLWGVRDLYAFYYVHSRSLIPLFLHVAIYGLSMTYFINPRIRHLYFDPKLRWWRSKRRYETHVPFLMNHNSQWFYPILTNVSESGCFIETPHLLEVNSTMQITIPLPVPLNVSVIKTEGEVRWVSKNPLRLGMGVEFKHPPPEYSKALKQFVRHQL